MSGVKRKEAFSLYRWCRRYAVAIFGIAVFGTVLAAVALARIYTDSDSVRQLISRVGANILPNSKLDMDGARARALGELQIDSPSWKQKDRQGHEHQILKKGQMTIQHDSKALATGELKIRKVTAIGSELQFHFDKAGRCAAFSFRETKSETVVRDPIAMEISGASVLISFESCPTLGGRLTDVAGRMTFIPNVSTSVDLRGKINESGVELRGDVDMKNRSAKIAALGVRGAPLGKLLGALPDSMKGSLPSGVFSLGKADLDGTAEVAWRDDQPSIAGRMSAKMHQESGRTFVKSAHLAAAFDSKSGVLDVHEATLSDVDLAAALPLVPKEHRGKISSPETLRGALQASARGKVRTKEQPFRWEGKATAVLTNAGWSPPQSPFPIADAAATIDVTPAGLVVEKASARIGPTKVSASGVLPDWDANRARMDFTAADVPLTSEVRERLPDRPRDLWDKFKPEGLVSGGGEIAMNGGKPRFVGRVRLNQNAFTYEKFPYRVTNVEGEVEFKPDGGVAFGGSGSVAGGVAKLTGKLADLTPTAEMDLTITGSDVAIDDDVRRAFYAIKPAADAISKIHALGKAKGEMTIKRRAGSRIVRVDSNVDLELRDFRSDWFPYPLERVTGRVTTAADRIEFQNCVGVSHAGAIVCMEGWSQRDEALGDQGETQGRSHLQLDFFANDVPLDATLRDSIPAAWHSVWDHLHPEGSLALTARFAAPAGKAPTIAFRFDAAHASIKPAAFPYRLHDIRGPVEMRGGVVYWKELAARHGRAEWRSGNGYVRTSSEGGELHFDRLSTPRLAFDADLKAALPPHLQSVVSFLSPSVPAEDVSLQDFTVHWSTAPGTAPTFELGEGKLTFIDADLAPAIGAKKVTGKIALSGFCKETADFKGNVYLSSITLAGLKASALQTRMVVHGPKIEFKDLAADFYGGKLHGAQVLAVVEPVPEYRAVFNVMGASLRDYIRQTTNSEMPLDGEVAATAMLYGKGDSIGKLSGHGMLDMRDVDVVRLPILLDQLNFLVNKLPEGKRFDQLRTNYQLDGPRMFLSDLRISSPAFTVGLQNGTTGVVDLARGRMDVNMVYELTRRGGRLPLLTGATAFHVGGAFGEPKITPTPYSGLRKALSPASWGKK